MESKMQENNQNAKVKYKRTSKHKFMGSTVYLPMLVQASL